ncbi:hypothetical protein TrRE_jg173, partial [Triparma retinervis]
PAFAQPTSQGTSSPLSVPPPGGSAAVKSQGKGAGIFPPSPSKAFGPSSAPLSPVRCPQSDGTPVNAGPDYHTMDEGWGSSEEGGRKGIGTMNNMTTLKSFSPWLEQ